MADGAAPAIVITGPTASGKSELAVEVAERVGGEIISADSRQVYRHMEVGTAKPPPALRERVPHHGLDLLEPDESYSAGRFAREAWTWIDEIRARDRVPVVCGGTGLFIRALISPLGPEPEIGRARRDALRRRLVSRPVPELKRWLRRLDPARARALQEEGGPQRLARSLEVVLLSGRRHSWWLARPPETPALAASVYWLWLPREALYRRIDRRLDAMIEAGLLTEVRRLLARFPADAPGLKSVGYGELAAHIRGELSRAEAVEAAKRSTHHLARRQLTWFRHQLPANAVRLEANRSTSELAAEVVRDWRDRGATGSARTRGVGSSD